MDSGGYFIICGTERGLVCIAVGLGCKHICQRLCKVVPFSLMFRDKMSMASRDFLHFSLRLPVCSWMLCRSCEVLDAKQVAYQGETFAGELYTAIGEKMGVNTVQCKSLIKETFSKCVDWFLEEETVRATFKSQSVMMRMYWLCCVGFGNSPRITIAMNVMDSAVVNSLNFCSWWYVELFREQL